MTPDNILVLLILFGALVLFISERLRVDVVALMVLATLILTGLVTAEEAFSGFSSPAVITVWAVFIISGALFYTGVADALGRFMLRLGGRSPLRITVLTMVTVGFMSAFMNNIGAVAILLPALITVSQRVKIPASKLLIPLAFASLMGGNMTLIGTPPNILASGILESYADLEPFSFFDFLPTGLIVLAAGIMYMALIGRHLLPTRYTPSQPSQAYRLRPYLTEMRVTSQSPLIGKTITEGQFGDQFKVSVIHIRRGEQEPLFPALDRQVQENDILLMEGRPGDLLNAGEAFNLVQTPGEPSLAIEQELTPESARLVEVTLAPRSDLVGRTLREIDFRARYGLNILAIRHQGQSLLNQLADTRLEFGDALLIQGPVERVNQLRQDPSFLILDTPPLQRRRLRKGRITLLILFAALGVITFGWLPPSAAMFIGALLMVLSGSLRMDEAYESIEWKSIFLIAGILPLGIAMESTGTAALIAGQITELFGGLGPRGILVGVAVMTALITAIISNAAATVLIVPIAIDVAFSIGASPHAFVLAVVIAASTSFIFPIGHQANVIVFGPGGYRFTDYTKVGVFLTIIILLIVAFILPLFWPLFPAT